MKKVFYEFDWLLLLAVLVLSILSLVTIGSIASHLITQQVIYLFLGLILLAIFSRIDCHIFQRFAHLIFIGCLFFLLTPLMFGVLTRGALRWIYLGPFSIQPSELVKPFLIIFFASFFSSKRTAGLKEVFTSGLILTMPLFLIFIQPDLGSSLVTGFSWLGITLAAGASWRLVIGGSFLVFSLFPLIWKFLKDYQRQRIFSFLHPLADPLGAGYNLIQAMVAVGSGQLIGRGLGRGTQSHLKFLPERHTDFIFASLAEEFGFLGSTVLILAFGVLLWRILVVGHQSKDSFGMLVCLGFFTLFFSQVFINIGMNLGLLPITGITLPLISYGGSSLVATMISLGIIENISRLKKTEETIKIS